MGAAIAKSSQDKILPFISKFVVRNKVNINELVTFSVKAAAGD